MALYCELCDGRLRKGEAVVCLMCIRRVRERAERKREQQRQRADFADAVRAPWPRGPGGGTA